MNAAYVAQNLKGPELIEAAGDVMRRDYHIPDTQMRADKTTCGLFP
jgi:hypothetical protein